MLASNCNQLTAIEDCSPNRKVVETIEHKNGIIIKVTDQYLIALDSINSGKRYFPCNLSNEFKVENKIIKFSGKVKEIFPNERLIGTPFVLTSWSK